MRGDVHGHFGSVSSADDRSDDTTGETRVGTLRGGASVVLEDHELGCVRPGGADRVLRLLADCLSGGSAECFGAVRPGIWVYWDVCGFV